MARQRGLPRADFEAADFGCLCKQMETEGQGRIALAFLTHRDCVSGEASDLTCTSVAAEFSTSDFGRDGVGARGATSTRSTGILFLY